jgi:Arm DNA-binding domain
MALTALQVKNAKPGDKLTDGGGLRLDVDKNANKSWVFRFTSPVTGRERFMGLGPIADVALAQARDAAQEARALIREGKDPIESRKEQRTAAKVEASRSITFKAYAEQFISNREAGWKNADHRQQWRNSLRDHAHPHIGHLPVSDVDTAAVLKVLRPIWSTKPDSASRIRGRIESILSAAKAEGLRAGENQPPRPKGCELVKIPLCGVGILIRCSPLKGECGGCCIIPHCPMPICRASWHRYWPMRQMRHYCSGSSS